MSKLSTVGFDPPSDFPVEKYNKVHACLNKYKETDGVQWALFGLGWNGLAYRYRAMDEYDNQFTTSIKKFGNSPPPEERYNQGKTLFGFFVNAISVFECFFFAIYFIASILKPKQFPLSRDEIKFYPSDVIKGYIANFGGSSLSDLMKQCLKQSTYWEINNIRRVLLHRGMPPRSFYKGGEHNGLATMPTNPDAPSDQWQFEFQIDTNTTSSYRQWISNTINELVMAASDFCDRNL